MVPSKESDLEIVLEGELHEPSFPDPSTSQEEQIDIVRATVGLTKEAARAISITASGLRTHFSRNSELT